MEQKDSRGEFRLDKEPLCSSLTLVDQFPIFLSFSAFTQECRVQRSENIKPFSPQLCNTEFEASFIYILRERKPISRDFSQNRYIYLTD